MSISLQQISTGHPLWLCDVWGVIHNGHDVFGEAVHALQQHRANGGTVVLLTNSPRTHLGVARQLADLGMADGGYDAIVTSGDVTQDLLRQHAEGRVFHLGPTRDMSIFDGQNLERVSLDEAKVVLCTGLFHDERETPADYVTLLADMKARNLTMICANPDKIVRKGSRLLFCAGSLGDAYAEIGGRVLMAGKPFTPIYKLAFSVAARVAGKEFTPAQAIGVGDGPETDIRGAADFGLPAVLIGGGINDASHSLPALEAQVLRLVPEARILLTLPALSWG